MGSTSYTTGPIQGHTPLWSHLSCSTTSMRLLCIERTIRLVDYGLPTSSDPFLRPHTEGNRHAQEPTFRAPRATGNIRPTGQRHRPQLIHRNLQNQKAPTEQNPTLRQAIPVITKAKPSLFPSASPPISPRRSRCFRSPTPVPLRAAAAPGTVLRTNTAPDFFQLLQPIRPEPPHETPQSSHPFLRLFTSVQIRECSVFALTWSQWAAIMTAFPVPLA